MRARGSLPPRRPRWGARVGIWCACTPDTYRKICLRDAAESVVVEGQFELLAQRQRHEPPVICAPASRVRRQRIGAPPRSDHARADGARGGWLPAQQLASSPSRSPPRAKVMVTAVYLPFLVGYGRRRPRRLCARVRTAQTASHEHVWSGGHVGQRATKLRIDNAIKAAARRRRQINTRHAVVVGRRCT